MPRSAASVSTRRKRRSNLAVARRSAVSGSMSSLRARLAVANSKSPISSSSAAGGARSSIASSISSSSSSILSMTESASGQSKPMRAARREILAARTRAGRAIATPSTTLAASPLASRSAALCTSQASFWAATEAISASPNTCGCRRSILSAIAWATSPNANSPASSAIRA